MAVQDAEAPRRQHQQAGAREQHAHDRDRQIAFRSGESRRDERNQQWRQQNAEEHQDRGNEAEQRNDRAGDTCGLAPIAASQQRCIHGNERRRERAFTKEILKNVRDPEGRHECISGIRLQAEVMGEDALPNEAGEAAEEDPERDQRCHGQPSYSASAARQTSAAPPQRSSKLRALAVIAELKSNAEIVVAEDPNGVLQLVF